MPTSSDTTKRETRASARVSELLKDDREYVLCGSERRRVAPSITLASLDRSCTNSTPKGEFEAQAFAKPVKSKAPACSTCKAFSILSRAARQGRKAARHEFAAKKRTRSLPDRAPKTTSTTSVSPAQRFASAIRLRVLEDRAAQRTN
jgi:hypothetical protein